MPKIQEYNSQVSPIGETTARGADPADFGAGIGQSIAGLGDMLRQKEERDAQFANEKTVSATRLKMTQVMSAMQTNAPEGGSGFMQSFLDTFDEYTQDLTDNAQTPTARKSLQADFAQMRATFGEQAIHFEANASAVMQVNTVDRVAADGANTVLSDPTQLSDTLAQVNRVIENAPGLNGTQKAELRQKAADQIHVSAVEGVIHMNPELAESQLQGGMWDSRLPAGKKEALMSMAQQGINAQATQQRLAQAAAEKARKAHYNDVANVFLGATRQGKLTVKDVLASDLPAFGEISKETFLTMLDKTAKERGKTGTMVNMLFQKIWAGDITDSSQLVKYVGSGVTVDDFPQLAKEIDGVKLPNGIAIGAAKKAVVDDAKAQLDKSNMILTDPLGQHQLNLFTNWFSQAYQDGISAGKTPQDLLAPTSKDYLGNGVGMFQRNLNEKLESLLGQYGGQDALPKTVTFQVQGGQSKSMALTDPQVDEMVAAGAKVIIPPDIQQKVLAPLVAKLASTGQQSLTPQEQSILSVYQRLGALDSVMKQAVTAHQTQVDTKTQQEQQALSQARAAIAAGKEPDAVKARLKEMGIDPGKL